MAYNLQSFIKSATSLVPGVKEARAQMSLASQFLPKKAQALTAPSTANMSTNKGPVTAPAPNLGATATQTTPIAPATKSSLSPLGQQYASTFNNQGSTGGQAPLNPYNPTSGIVPPPTMPSGATNTPQPAAPKSTARDQYIAAYRTYQEAQKSNKAVEEARKTYNDFVANQAKSIAGIEGQGRGIPLQIVRGTQEKLLGQTQPEAQRLQNEIAIAQQSQQGMVDAAKTEAELQKELLGIDVAAQKPIEVGGVLYAQQPDGSYKALTSSTKAAEGFTLGKDQVRYDAQGNLIAGNISGGTNGQAYTPGSDPTADAWVKYVQSGGDISKVPNDYQNTVIQGLSGTSTGNTQATNEQLNFLTTALNKAEELKGAAGRGGISRAIGGALSGDNDFNRLAKTLDSVKTNVLTLMSDPNVKKFFGPQMTNNDVQLMMSIGTMLDPIANTPQDIQDEVTRIRDLVTRANNAVRMGSSSMAPDEEEYLRNQGFSPQEIQALKGQSFNSVGNTSASTLSQAIARQESSGNYSAFNKDSGALGKYQIMPATLKGLGYNVTPQQFLASPQLQEEAHSKLISELNTRYNGNIDKVLADYYGGPKAAQLVGTQAGNVPQNGYPSINQYVAQVKQKLNIA